MNLAALDHLLAQDLNKDAPDRAKKDRKEKKQKKEKRQQAWRGCLPLRHEPTPR